MSCSIPKLGDLSSNHPLKNQSLRYQNPPKTWEKLSRNCWIRNPYSRKRSFSPPLLLPDTQLSSKEFYLACLLIILNSPSQPAPCFLSLWGFNFYIFPSSVTEAISQKTRIHVLHCLAMDQVLVSWLQLRDHCCIGNLSKLVSFSLASQSYYGNSNSLIFRHNLGQCRGYLRKGYINYDFNMSCWP